MHLKMQMRTGRATGAATDADDLTSLDHLADLHEDMRVMGVQGGEAMRMDEPHCLAVGPMIASEHHNPCLHRLYRGAGGHTEVDARVHLRACASQHMVALAKE